jgi:tripartite-type tricarboxylate transporter receptor subunit TctC
MAHELQLLAELQYEHFVLTVYDIVVFARSDRLHREVADNTKSPEIQKRLAAEGLLAQGTAPAAFEKFIMAEIDKWAKVTKAAGIAAR